MFYPNYQLVQIKTIGNSRSDYGCIIIFYRTYVNARSKELLRNRLDARNFGPGSKIKVS